MNCCSRVKFETVGSPSAKSPYPVVRRSVVPAADVAVREPRVTPLHVLVAKRLATKMSGLAPASTSPATAGTDVNRASKVAPAAALGRAPVTGAVSVQ